MDDYFRNKWCDDVLKTHFRLANARRYVDTPTYDGSGQVVHPDMLIFNSLFRGKKYFLCVDPFPNSNATKENPSILVSSETNKKFDTRVDNDLIPNPISGTPESGWFNSDSEIMWWKNRFWLYWRCGQTANYHRILKLKTSEDLIGWTDEIKVMTYNAGGSCRYASPSFVPENDKAYCWFLKANDGSVHLFETVTGKNLDYVQQCSLTMPARRTIWHADIAKLSNGEYWILCCDTKGSLWYGISRDRVHWEIASEKVLDKSLLGWDNKRIYRATFAVEDGKILVWYSAQSRRGRWHCGYVESNVAGLGKSITSHNIIN